MTDGSAVSATVSDRAPGAGPGDIPRLTLLVASRRGADQLDGVTTIHRFNTRGGVAEGSCDLAGAFLRPHEADYAFFRLRGRPGPGRRGGGSAGLGEPRGLPLGRRSVRQAAGPKARRLVRS